METRKDGEKLLKHDQFLYCWIFLLRSKCDPLTPPILPLFLAPIPFLLSLLLSPSSPLPLSFFPYPHLTLLHALPASLRSKILQTPLLQVVIYLQAFCLCFRRSLEKESENNFRPSFIIYFLFPSFCC